MQYWFWLDAADRDTDEIFFLRLRTRPMAAVLPAEMRFSSLPLFKDVKIWGDDE